MDTLGRLVMGRFRPTELRRYLLVEAAVFWGIIFVAWLSYPREHQYSIMTHTFSFLGSYESKHNPEWWWIFSIAMCFWGSATMPVTLYICRRFAAISRWGARIGAFLLLAGCVGIILVALFPDAHGKIVGSIESTHIHEKAALLIAAGLSLGIIWHAMLLLRDWLSRRRTRADSGFAHGRFVWPYLMWTIVVGTGSYFLIKWEFVYADMKAAAAATGQHIGSSWSEALNTRYAFPLWENLAIYALFLFLIWFPLALPAEVPAGHREDRSKSG